MPWPRRPLRFASIPSLSARFARDQTRAFGASTTLVFGLGLTLLAAFPLGAQVLEDPSEPTVTYPVGGLILEYANPHPDHPSLEGFLPVEVALRSTDAGWSGPKEGAPTQTIVIGGPGSETLQLDGSGVVEVLSAVVAQLHEAGFYGIEVRPSARDFDLENERDLRAGERDSLALEIRIGRIGQVRTVASGTRVRSDWKIDNEIHERIRLESPLQPTGVGNEDATDLLDRRALEDYLHRLNRHSGRRVEAALAPGEKPGEVTLDYRVLESKPWFAYAQATNTGTRRTNRWQTRFGYTHRQLSDRDDVLAIEYLNAGQDEVNALSARYQAPFFGSQRPDWMARRRGDPEWLDLIPREDIPWWGVDRMRWEVEFNWNESRAGSSATLLNLANDEIRSSQYQYGGRVSLEAYQYKNFFIDVWAGIRMRHLSVRNRTSQTKGDALLVVPRIGIHADRKNQLSTLTFDLSLDGQVNAIDDTNREALGRRRTDDRYALLHYNFGYSTYLEPLLNPEAWRDPATHTSSTLAHEISFGFRGQHGLDDVRLIPQANGAIGGFYSVRGYPQSEGVGDTIVIGSVEYRFHVPRIFPVKRKPLNLPLIGDFRVAPQQVYGRPDWDLTLRAYVDVGRAIRHDLDGGAPLPEKDRTLVGAGLGAELTFRSNFRARIDWATALKNQTADGGPDGPNAGIDVGDSEIHVLFSIVY